MVGTAIVISIGISLVTPLANIAKVNQIQDYCLRQQMGEPFASTSPAPDVRQMCDDLKSGDTPQVAVKRDSPVRSPWYVGVLVWLGWILIATSLIAGLLHQRGLGLVLWGDVALVAALFSNLAAAMSQSKL